MTVEILRVWVTRSDPGARSTSAALAARGFEPLAAPLLIVSAIDAALVPEPGEAIAFTSLNAVSRAARLSPVRDQPVFAVGRSTAAAARAAGFLDVTSAAGDVAALAQMIAIAAPAGGVLHPCGEETAGDLTGALRAAGIRLRRVVLYRTDPIASVPPLVAAALETRKLFAILLHSPKAARTAAGLLKNGPPLGSLMAFGLSVGCVHPLSALGLAALIAAPDPAEDSLLNLLTDAAKAKP